MSNSNDEISGAIFLFGIVVGFVIIWGIQQIGGEKIFPEVIDTAIEICSNNGGVKFFVAEVAEEGIEVECNNGVYGDTSFYKKEKNDG
jgi:hypothetical protein